MSSQTIKKLLQNNNIWQASQKVSLRPALSTGYGLLDKQLHYRGWPRGAISELLISHHGMGEIRLLIPLLAKLSRQSGYIVWINPPYQPYAPALVEQQIALDKLLVIKTQSLQDTLWAGQQAMTSKNCSAVLIWLPDKPLNNEIRRLCLAAKNGHCWGIIFRSKRLQQHPSPAVLRIKINIQQAQHQLSIVKQPGGWAGQEIKLDLFPERALWNALAVEHWPIFSMTENKLQSKVITSDHLLTSPLLQPLNPKLVDNFPLSMNLH